jgi:V8-like Glu-specific endopeptidase
MQSQVSRRGTERPMVADELIQLDNTPERISPERLEEIARRRLVVSSVSARKRPQLEPRELEDVNAWEFDLDEDFVVGHLGDRGEAVEVPGTEARGEDELDAYLPEGDGITYHPKIGTDRIHEPLVRRKGEIITPHGYIFGPDDRVVYFPSGYPWRCVGKIFAWTNPSGGPAWVGSGSLVGRNVVLTASHVCPWGSDPWMMLFVPGYWDGSSTTGSGVRSYVQSYRGYREHGQGDDMAVLRLYTPLGDSLGYFGYKTYNDDWEGGNYWTKAGYPTMIAGGQRPARIQWYPIVDDDSDGAGVELEYKADSSGGDSGDPVFGWWSGWPYVVGTHSGGEEEYEFPWYIIKNNVAAGGGALSSLIGWARSNW